MKKYFDCENMEFFIDALFSQIGIGQFISRSEAQEKESYTKNPSEKIINYSLEIFKNLKHHSSVITWSLLVFYQMENLIKS